MTIKHFLLRPDNTINNSRFAPIAWVPALLIVGIYTLKFPLFLFLGLGLLLFAVTTSLTKLAKIDKLGLIVIISYLYWLCSGFLVGAVGLSDFALPEFYAGDGRIFLSYLPLLFFSMYSARQSDMRRIARLIVRLGLGSVALLLLWLIARPSFISGGSGNNLFAFSTSHHGSGAIFSMIAIFLLIHGTETKRLRLIFLGALVIAAVFASGSRSSFVGILAVVFWYLFRNLKLRVLLAMALLAVVAVSTLPFVSPHTYERTAAIFTPEMADHALDTLKNSRWEPGKDADVEGTELNILHRLLFWSYAVNRFLESPVFGIGFGRYNDIDLQTYGIEGVAQFAVDGTKVFSAATAHNSYLHTLAESGLVGIVLLYMLWGGVYSRAKKAARHYPKGSGNAAYFLACQAIVIFVLAASMFGHWCAAPAVVIPALTIIGLGLSFHRAMLKAEAGGKAPVNSAQFSQQML